MYIGNFNSNLIKLRLGYAVTTVYGASCLLHAIFFGLSRSDPPSFFFNRYESISFIWPINHDFINVLKNVSVFDV